VFIKGKSSNLKIFPALIIFTCLPFSLVSQAVSLLAFLPASSLHLFSYHDFWPLLFSFYFTGYIPDAKSSSVVRVTATAVIIKKTFLPCACKDQIFNPHLLRQQYT
jgi:hypothetical protein